MPRNRPSRGYFCSISDDVSIPDDCTIGDRVTIQGQGHIGSGVVIDTGTILRGRFHIANNVTVGPYALVEGDCFVGEGTNIGPFCCIGTPPQHLSYKDNSTSVRIGSGNVIREYVTIHRATDPERVTQVGNDCLFMAYCHIAHDCTVGNRVILANGVNVGGHAEIGDYANIGLMVCIHQFSRIGSYSMVGMGYRVTRDVPPYVLVAGEPLAIIQPNIVGLKRAGFSEDAIKKIGDIYKVLCNSQCPFSERVAAIESEAGDELYAQTILQFYRNSKRGLIARKRRFEI